MSEGLELNVQWLLNGCDLAAGRGMWSELGLKTGHHNYY